MPHPKPRRSFWWKLWVVIKHPYQCARLSWMVRGNTRIVYDGIRNGQQSYSIVRGEEKAMPDQDAWGMARVPYWLTPWVFYRPLMRLAHRFNWHYAPMKPRESPQKCGHETDACCQTCLTCFACCTCEVRADEHNCDFPSDPKDGTEFACYQCGVLWEWIQAINTWESTGAAEEASDAKP